MATFGRVRKWLRPVRRALARTKTGLVELPHRIGHASRGSAAWLVKREIAYGGLVSDVARMRVSPWILAAPSNWQAAG